MAPSLALPAGGGNDGTLPRKLDCCSGFLGLSDKVRKGYSAIRVKLRVKTQAAAETIEGLTAMSPVLDTVSRSVPVTVSVETY